MDEIHTSLGTATSAALLAGGARAGENVWGDISEGLSE